MNRFGNILHRLSIATALAVALPLALVVSAVPDANAQTNTEEVLSRVYTVRDVPVDVTAENAARAREQALAEGQVEALQQLMRRLTPAARHGSLPTPSREEAENLVLAISPSNEKTSAVRYLADLTVSFVPQSVQQYLEDQGVAFVDQPAQPVVVVPVWRPAPDAEPVLWEDPNPWREAWANATIDGLVPLEIPLGDLEDVAALPAPQAAAMDQQGLNALAARYGAERALVAVAELQPGEPQVVEVRATRTDQGGETYTARVQVEPDQDLRAALATAVSDIATQVENAYTSRAVLLSGPASGQLTALVPVRSLDEWLGLRRRMEQAQVVREVVLQALAKDRAQVTITFAGGPDKLAEAFARQDLTLDDSSGYWVVRPGAPSVLPTFDEPSGQPMQEFPAAAPSSLSAPLNAGSAAPTSSIPPQFQPPPLPSITQPLRQPQPAGQGG